MSAIITGKVFWTPFKDLAYQDKHGKAINIKETTAKIVMLAIADSADDYGENSWQSFETIAAKASIERRSVIRVVRALIEHKYLTVAGVTQYGTNNFTVNKDLLGCPPARRARVGRPKGSDLDAKIGDSEAGGGDSGTKTGDPGAKNGDGQSPDPSLTPPSNHPDNHPLPNLEAIALSLGLDWLIATGQPITQKMIDDAILQQDAIAAFEKAFCTTPPWGTKEWKKIKDLAIREYAKNPEVFSMYVDWRDNGKGRYGVGMSNTAIRNKPQVFLDTGFPTFAASMAMHPPKNAKKGDSWLCPKCNTYPCSCEEE